MAAGAKSALLTGRDIAATLLASGVQTIAFARSRVQTELLLTYLRSRFPQPQWPSDLIRGYRGGYLPSERRAIEHSLPFGLYHGDVVVWGGASRLCYHGVTELKDGEHEKFGRMRINLTFRRAL